MFFPSGQLINKWGVACLCIMTHYISYNPCQAHLRIIMITDFSVKRSLLQCYTLDSMPEKVLMDIRLTQLIEHNGTNVPYGITSYPKTVALPPFKRLEVAQFVLPDEIVFYDNLPIIINKYITTNEWKFPYSNAIALTKNNKPREDGTYSVIICIDEFGDAQMIDYSPEQYNCEQDEKGSEQLSLDIKKPKPLPRGLSALLEKKTADVSCTNKGGKKEALTRLPYAVVHKNMQPLRTSNHSNP